MIFVFFLLKDFGVMLLLLFLLMTFYCCRYAVFDLIADAVCFSNNDEHGWQ